MAVEGDRKKRGPYIFSIPYIVAGIDHELTWQCQIDGTAEPGTLPIDIDLKTRNGAGRTLADAAATFWNIARFILPAEAVTAQFYLQRAQAGTDKLFYVSSGELVTPAAGPAYGPSRQATMTFRTAMSSVMRLVFLESGLSLGDAVTPLSADGQSDDSFEQMAAWVTNPLSPVLGTDASWIVAPLSLAHTQNEAIYQARNRK